VFFSKFNIPQPEADSQETASNPFPQNAHEERERYTVIDVSEYVTVKSVDDVPLSDEEKAKIFVKEPNMNQHGMWINIKNYKRFNN
jgi:hypothetical protein